MHALPGGAFLACARSPSCAFRQVGARGTPPANPGHRVPAPSFRPVPADLAGAVGKKPALPPPPFGSGQAPCHMDAGVRGSTLRMYLDLEPGARGSRTHGGRRCSSWTGAHRGSCARHWLVFPPKPFDPLPGSLAFLARIAQTRGLNES